MEAQSQRPDIKIKGQWFIKLYGEDGQLKDERQGWNVITTDGKDFLASYLYSGAAAASTFTMKYIAIGTDSTGEAAANTALGTEVARHTGTVSYISGAIYQVTATFATGVGTGAIVEYGLFSSSATGSGSSTMLSRDTESVINKGANDTLTVITQVSFT